MTKQLLSAIVQPVQERVETLADVYRQMAYELATNDDWSIRDLPFFGLICLITTVGILIVGRPTEDYPRGDPRRWDGAK